MDDRSVISTLCLPIFARVTSFLPWRGWGSSPSRGCSWPTRCGPLRPVEGARTLRGSGRSVPRPRPDRPAGSDSPEVGGPVLLVWDHLAGLRLSESDDRTSARIGQRRQDTRSRPTPRRRVRPVSPPHGGAFPCAGGRPRESGGRSPKDKTTRRRESVLPREAGTSGPYTLKAEKKTRTLIPGRNMARAIFVPRARKSFVSSSFLPTDSFSMVLLAFRGVDLDRHRIEPLLEELDDSPLLHGFREETAELFQVVRDPLKQSVPA